MNFGLGKKISTYLFFLLLGVYSGAQTNVLTGKVSESKSNTPIASASILVFSNGKYSGTVSNTDGAFAVQLSDKADSIRISCIGHKTVLLDIKNNKPPNGFLEVKMEIEFPSLPEVVVKPIPAAEIIRKAILASQEMMPASNFENDFFYREIIKDRNNYFSVAEAVFKGQFTPSKNDYKLKLVKGRSKEDVSYTRLFEDFHPGGGPQALLANKLITGFPDFLTPKKLGSYNFSWDSIIRQDDKKIFIISFDQRPDVHEALDKGKIFIDANDYAILKYESENSLLGIKYVKHLTGTDKIFAELLRVDLKRKGWKRKAEFIKHNGKLYFSYAFGEYQIEYKQPKKQIDLDLTISSEIVSTTQASPIQQVITDREEWKRNDIVANLPTDFDADYWGDASIISPTAQINNIIEGIGKNNPDQRGEKPDSKWQFFQKDFFVAYQNHDTITMIPVMKGAWEDEKTGGMLYQTVAGNFSIETELKVSRKSDPGDIPDNGFQQAGIIVRKTNGAKENSLLVSIGTSGNKNVKYFLRKTENSHSKGSMNSIENLHQWLRIEKKGNVVSAFIKNNREQEWQKIASYTMEWNNESLEVGMMIMARFAGDGPKMKPDIRAQFSNIKIEKE